MVFPLDPLLSKVGSRSGMILADVTLKVGGKQRKRIV
jgi:hypothetical protein